MTYYDSIAPGYDELHGEEQGKKLSIILANLPEGFEPKKDDELLDIGCGTGISTAFWNCKTTGIDPSDKLIAIARSKYRAGTFLVARAENMPFDEEEFDMITSLTALQNFDDIKAALAEIRRVAKPECRFILTFLKKSEKADMMEQEINKHFNIIKRVEEEKDIILFCS